MSPPHRGAGRRRRSWCPAVATADVALIEPLSCAVRGFDVIGSHLADEAALTAPAQVPGTVEPVVPPVR